MVSCSPDLRSIGDQPPAILPAMIPAIAAGPKTEFELDRARRLVFSGVCGEEVVGSAADCSTFGGVRGKSLLERDLDLDPLRERGR